jgi:hypothetical protein
VSESDQERRQSAVGFQDLPDDIWDDVIAVCEQFEQDWSQETKIEDFLGETEGPAKRFRMLKLLEIELEKRRTRGETPRGWDYLERFPGEDTLIRAAFQEVGLPFDDHVPDSDFDATARLHSTDSMGSQTPPPARALPKLDGYELLEQIGEGGWA